MVGQRVGEPEKFGAARAFVNIGNRKGVISFYQLWGSFDRQGHIDLVARHAKCHLLVNLLHGRAPCLRNAA